MLMLVQIGQGDKNFYEVKTLLESWCSNKILKSIKQHKANIFAFKKKVLYKNGLYKCVL